jgi:hypothetical protein
METIVKSTKIKRYDKIGTLLNGIKIVDYIVHYPKSECVCIVYTDNTFVWCTDFEDIKVDRPKRSITLKHVTNEYVNYDSPTFINSKNLLEQFKK